METQPQIPLRTLRNLAEALAPTRLTPRQQARQDRILLIATELIARFGRGAFSFNRLAQAMRYAASTLRWHFVDLDALLLHIMQQHIVALTRTLAFMSQNAPDRAARARVAYRAAFFTADGSQTAAYRIFLAERKTLPLEDQAILAECIGKLAAQLPGLDPETLALPEAAAPELANAPPALAQALPLAPIRLSNLRPASLSDETLHHAAVGDVAKLLDCITAQTDPAPLSRRAGLNAGTAQPLPA